MGFDISNRAKKLIEIYGSIEAYVEAVKLRKTETREYWIRQTYNLPPEYQVGGYYLEKPTGPLASAEVIALALSLGLIKWHECAFQRSMPRKEKILINSFLDKFNSQTKRFCTIKKNDHDIAKQKKIAKLTERIGKLRCEVKNLEGELASINQQFATSA
jgi:hypothetical protein